MGHAQYGPVHFGFALSGRGPLARPDALVKLAEAAEALRYSSIFTFRVPLDLASRRARPAAGNRTPFTGTSAEVIQDIRAYQALGVTHFVFDGVPQDLRGRLAMMERFAEDVRPKVLRAPR